MFSITFLAWKCFLYTGSQEVVEAVKKGRKNYTRAIQRSIGYRDGLGMGM